MCLKTFPRIGCSITYARIETEFLTSSFLPFLKTWSFPLRVSLSSVKFLFTYGMFYVLVRWALHVVYQNVWGWCWEMWANQSWCGENEAGTWGCGALMRNRSASSYFADWLNIQFKTWYFQLSSVKICKPFKARTASLYGPWHDGTPVPDASKCMGIVCFLFGFVFFSPSTLESGVVIPVVVYDYPNDSRLLGFRQHN